MKNEKRDETWWDCAICLSERSVWKFLPEKFELNYEIEEQLVCQISLCPESYGCDEEECQFHYTPEGMLRKLIEVSKQPWSTDRVVADLVRSLEGYIAAVERETREWVEAIEREERQEEREKKLAAC
jgi:hypothetical protein